MVRQLFRWGRRHPALVLLVAENLFLALPSLKSFALQVETTPAERGQQLADQFGCFRCHGPNGTGGVPNPGSKEGEVPGFLGGMLMMYVENADEIREYVLEGMPARKRTNPEYVSQMEQQALRMPAFRGYLSEGELDDLLAYLHAASGLVQPDDEAAVKGMELAYEKGCFACHNVMGSGGFANPGSFKGYIPGWWGSDFEELVTSEEELREWIEKGEIKRLTSHPIARYFVEWQRAKMPKFEKFLKPREIDALVSYVRWVHEGKWRRDHR